MATKWHCVPGKHNTVPLKQNGLHLAKTEDQLQRGINFTISHPTPFLPILPSGNLAVFFLFPLTFYTIGGCSGVAQLPTSTFTRSLKNFKVCLTLCSRGGPPWEPGESPAETVQRLSKAPCISTVLTFRGSLPGPSLA